MAQSEDYYRVLQVDRSAEQEVIQAAYRRLSRKYHPDGSQPDPQHMRKLNAAYDVLGDEEKREAYDSRQQVQVEAQQEVASAAGGSTGSSSSHYRAILERQADDSDAADQGQQTVGPRLNTDNVFRAVRVVGIGLIVVIVAVTVAGVLGLGSLLNADGTDREVEIEEPTEPAAAVLVVGESGTELLKLDFEQPVVGWETLTTEGIEYGYDSGSYFIMVNQPETLAVSLTANQFGDVLIDAQVRVSRTGAGAVMGLYCRYQDALNYYAFEIEPGANARYRYVALVGGVESVLRDWQSLDAAQVGADGYDIQRLTVVCDSDALSLRVNDVFLDMVTDPRLSSGDAGVFVRTMTFGGARLALDSLTVSVP